MSTDQDTFQVTSPPTRARARRDPSARGGRFGALLDSLSAFRYRVTTRIKENRRKMRGATPAERAAPNVDRSDPWHDPPASLADLYAYTMSGAWAPGERHWSVELLGKAYGFTALVASAVLYVIAWVIQRPYRLLGAGLIGLVVGWTSGWSS